MARSHPPRYAHLVDGLRTRRFRYKYLIFVLIASMNVLVYVFHTQEGRGQQALSATSTKPTTDDYDSNAPEPANATQLPANSSSAAPAGLEGFDTLPYPSSSHSLDTLDYAAHLLTAESPRAVVIESRVTHNLVPLMLHFSTVLGPSWGLVLFTLQDGWIEPLSPPFQRLRRSGHIQVRFLPPSTDFSSSYAFSRFMTGPWLWEQLRTAKRVLLFQTDSTLCANAEASVESFFEYDFVGAPIAPMYGAGYNGGLSVRNPRTFLEVTKAVDFAASGNDFEDQYFYAELKKRRAPMPEVEIAKRFSVETIYYETPLGFHQPQRWQQDHMADIEKWCPEVKMLIGRRST